MLKIILLCVFVALNIMTLFFIIVNFHFNQKETLLTLAALYIMLFKKILSTVLAFFRHPFKTTKYLILRIISLILNFIRIDVLTFGPIIIELIAPIALLTFFMKPLKWFLVIRIFLSFLIVATIYESKPTSNIFDKIHNFYRHLYSNLCYVYQFFKNAAETTYEDLHDIPHKQKVSPEDFKKAEYEYSASSYKDERKDKDKKDEEKAKSRQYNSSFESYSKRENLNGVIRRLNMTNRDDLKVFGLQGINFTEEERKSIMN